MTLTPEQRARLERLWFVYGNYGPKTTPGNHSFIQSLLEQGQDLRPLITKRSRKSEIPTPECEAAVDEVLLRVSTAEGGDRRDATGVLRMVVSTTESPRLSVDPERRATLDSMRRQGRATGRRLPDGDETPDAA